MNTEKPAFLTLLRLNCEGIRKGSDILYLQIIDLLEGLNIAEKSRMNKMEIKSIRMGIQKVLKKFPEDVRGKIA